MINDIQKVLEIIPLSFIKKNMDNLIKHRKSAQNTSPKYALLLIQQLKIKNGMNVLENLAIIAKLEFQFND